MRTNAATFYSVILLSGLFAPTAPDRSYAQQSWRRKFGRDDKWSFCLTAGTLCLRIRSDHEQTTAPEPHTGLQGEGGPCGRQRRSNNSSAGGAVRRAPEPDHVVESAA